jgi:hypothetical protein
MGVQCVAMGSVDLKSLITAALEDWYRLSHIGFYVVIALSHLISVTNSTQIMNNFK